MVTTTVSTDVTTTQNLGTGDTLILTDVGSIISIATSSYGVNFSGSNTYNLTAYIAGDVISSGSSLNFTTSSTGSNSGIGNHDVFIADTGTVTSLTNHGIVLKGMNNVVTNFGTVSGDSIGVYTWAKIFHWLITVPFWVSRGSIFTIQERHLVQMS